MSINASADPTYRRFAGYVDPSLPTGTWQGRVQLVGDASGGDMVAQLNLTGSAAGFNSRFYSLEDFAATKNSNTAVVANLLVLNMGEPGQSGNPRIYHAPFVVSDPLAVTDPAAVSALRGLWLGQQIAIGNNAGFTLTLTNSDGILVTVFLEGYFWAPLASESPGGPSRPAQGLYSGRG